MTNNEQSAKKQQSRPLMAIITKQAQTRPPKHITVKSYSAKNSLNIGNNFYQRLSKSK